MRFAIIASAFLTFQIFAQDKHPDNGRLDLGLRTTASIFGTDNTSGLGVGGQFRLRLLKNVNTEWFADYIKSNMEDLGNRIDGHIGWSVMFLPFEPGKKIEPYILAGHCFDYTKVSIYESALYAADSKSRWSSAVQTGIGANFNFSERINFALSAQYMLHLGKDIHTHIHMEENVRVLHFKDHDHSAFEGHIFLTLSMNIKIADLW
jgi:opacity protein-like surface antigen